jgi:ATP-dependent DNA helicase RecQ
MRGASADSIADTIDFLVAEGYLQIDERYATLSFTEKTLPFFKSGTRLLMRRCEETRERRRPEARKNAEYADSSLFEALRKVRMKISSLENVPPYVVFADAALREMCRRLPGDEREFLDVPGVGRTKLERYGAKFLGAIKKWRAQ